MKTTTLKPQFVILITILIFKSLTSSAQEGHSTTQPGIVIPPVPIETFATDDKLSFLMIVNKPIADSKKFSFFNVTSFKANYENVQQENEFLTQGLIQYELVKGLNLAAGATQHYRFGFRPTAGLNYTFANRKFLFVLLPRFDLTEDYNFETFSLFEYKPQLTEKLGLYTRVQGLYNWNTEQDFHDRSYIYFRVGLSYKSFQFGVGADFDTYGPMKISTEGYGLFLRTQLFN